MKGISFDRASRFTNRRRTKTAAGAPPRNRPKARMALFICAVLVAGLFVYGVMSGFRGRQNAMSAQSALYPALSVQKPEQASPPSSSGDATTGYNGVAAALGQNSTTTTSASSQAWDRMLIRTATLQLSVSNVLQSVDAVMSVVAEHGGQVLQMDNHESGEYSVSSVVIQVPSAEFDKVIPELHKLGGQVKKVVSENISSQDVTEEYTDLQSQLRNLQATETRLLALQQKADKLADILSLDHELRDIQGQIEQITGRTNFLSKRSEMSQITVQISPEASVAAVTPNPQAAWDPGLAAVQAWNASLDLLSKLTTVLITVAVFLWWVMPLALLGFWLARRTGKRSIVSSNAGSSGGESTAL